MNNRFDEFSKSLAESVPRRESLRRLGAAFAGTMLSTLGMGTAWAGGRDPCAAFCKCRNKAQQTKCLAACKACNGTTSHIGAGIAGAAIGIIGNLAVARYKLVVGRRINSATLVADARHSWLDALSSAGVLAGLIAVASGQAWGDPVAGLAITAVICHVGYQVTADVVHRLADGVDPSVITTAETAAGSVPGVLHAHARARWTGRTLRVEIEGWVDPGLPARDADAIGREVAAAVAQQLPEAGSLTWAARAGPS